MYMAYTVMDMCATMQTFIFPFFIKHENVVAIPKSNSVARTIENCRSSGWYITDEEMKKLNNAFQLNA